MASVNLGEKLVERTDMPVFDTVHSWPVIVDNDGILAVAYALPTHIAVTTGNKSALIVFDGSRAHRHGPPNDEALQGHRLYSLGLKPYTIHEVTNSRWIAEMCASNRVHPQHQDRLYSKLRHFVFTFKDSTLEVVAEGCSINLSADIPPAAILGLLTEQGA